MGRSRRTRARGKTHPTMMSFGSARGRATDAVQARSEPMLLQRIADLEDRMGRLEEALGVEGTKSASEPDEPTDPREHEVVDEG